MTSIKAFLKKEIVLVVAVFLAVVSTIACGPSVYTYSSIDLNTLLLLFSLMCVMQAFSKIGFFENCGKKLLGIVKGDKGLLLVLVLLPFFFGMFITNDVALITFVPFAIIVLKMAGKENLLIKVIVLQTIAANLGSMMLPMGNPQNLYLYNISGLTLGDFVITMLPYTIAALVLLVICVFCIKGNGKTEVKIAHEPSVEEKADENPNKKANPLALSKSSSYIAFTMLFAICLLAVLKMIPVSGVFAITLVFFLIFDRQILLKVDYSLLLTFVGFFVFVGNLKGLESFSSFLGSILEGNEILLSVGLSQIISNVPAALLLSGFTENHRAILIGVNLGGLGTLIASMASLISWKQVEKDKGKYLLTFTWMGLMFLAVLLALNYLLGLFGA
ncbi:MAG: anion permease [Treponema sp.]|nr:anion permease [Treponema sp.]